ncbi:hypothetical protein Kisp01_11060 [Kineosporia sp. NBRC 101677]|nr:hypothetical protein Kisp01_11060 [Kineosporia sp. NBRC 101677]
MSRSFCPGPAAVELGAGVLLLAISGRRASVPLSRVHIDQRAILTMGPAHIRRNDLVDVWRDDLLARNSNGCTSLIVSLRGENSASCVEPIHGRRREIVTFSEVHNGLWWGDCRGCFFACGWGDVVDHLQGRIGRGGSG